MTPCYHDIWIVSFEHLEVCAELLVRRLSEQDLTAPCRVEKRKQVARKREKIWQSSHHGVGSPAPTNNNEPVQLMRSIPSRRYGQLYGISSVGGKKIRNSFAFRSPNVGFQCTNPLIFLGCSTIQSTSDCRSELLRAFAGSSLRRQNRATCLQNVRRR